MRDYKLRKRVFNEYPTTTEVQKMIAQGGGGGSTKTPIASFELTPKTPVALDEAVGEELFYACLVLDVAFNGTKLNYLGTEPAGELIKVGWSDGDSTRVELGKTSNGYVIVGNAEGTVIFTHSDAPVIVIKGIYRSASQTIQIGEKFDQILSILDEGKACELKVSGTYNDGQLGIIKPVAIYSYYSATRNKDIMKFDCPITLDNEFVFHVDTDGTITGTVPSNNS